MQNTFTYTSFQWDFISLLEVVCTAHVSLTSQFICRIFSCWVTPLEQLFAFCFCGRVRK